MEKKPIADELIWFVNTPTEDCCGCGVITEVNEKSVIVRIRYFDSDRIDYVTFFKDTTVSECGKFERCDWQCEGKCST